MGKKTISTQSIFQSYYFSNNKSTRIAAEKTMHALKKMGISNLEIAMQIDPETDEIYLSESAVVALIMNASKK